MKTGNADRLIDVAVTMICWVYFIFAFLFFYSLFYIIAFLLPRSERLFQRLNHAFFRGFFALLRAIAPRQQWQIDGEISKIRSSVVVCNHLSYLDPILLISLLGQAKTIVKPVFFYAPVFGLILYRSGFFPARSTGPLGKLMLLQMESMGRYLSEGGNLFIFPEGTRSRDGRIGTLNQGAFKIARNCKAPVYVLCIRNTERLFTPGRFFFFARRPNRISVNIVDKILPGPSGRLGLTELNERIRRGLEGCMQETATETG